MKSIPKISNGEALEHLNEILASDSFSASRRCQQFLNYVVHETLEGRGATIKERTIATEVFGKGQQFEPGEDSLVRVKAREVRKRLAEFYGQHPDATLRIELPLGGYLPRIQPGVAKLLQASAPPLPPATDQVSSPKSFLTRRRLLWTGAACAAGAVAWPAIRYAQLESEPIDEFWKPVFSTGAPVLISIPLLPAEDGAITERVGLGAAAAANEAAEFFSRRRYLYRLRFGSDLTFSQLREQPSLLLGGFSSIWTQRMTSSLRFRLQHNADGKPGGSIYDAQTGKSYGHVLTKNGYTSEDYALICRLFDAATGQIILIAAGIATFGTECAAHFFFRPNLFSQLVEGQGVDWKKKNLQAVIRLSVIGTTPSTPTLVATHFW